MSLFEQNWWTHTRIGDGMMWVGGAIISVLAWIGRKVHKIHKIALSWNGHKVTVENHRKAD